MAAADSEISAILSRTTGKISSMAARATDLLEDAISVIERPPRWEDIDGWHPQEEGLDTGRDDPLLTPAGEKERALREREARRKANRGKISFPPFPTIKMPGSPRLLSPIVPQLRTAPSAPTLNLPDVTSLPEPPVPPPFTATSPGMVDTTFTLPPIPEEGDFPALPPLMEFPELEFPEFSIPTLPLLPPPSPRPAPVDVVSSTMDSIRDKVLDGDGGISALLAKLRNDDQSNQEFLDLVLEAAGVTPGGDEGSYSAAIAELSDRIMRMLDRLSPWSLPAAVAGALRGEVSRLVGRWESLGKGPIQSGIAKNVVDYREACGSALVGFIKAVDGMADLELKMAVKAFQFAGRYAKRMTALMLELHEIQNYVGKDVALRAADDALDLYSAQLDVATLDYARISALQEREKALQQRDDSKLLEYEAKADEAQRKVRLYAAQVSAARKERDLVGLPFDLWEIQIKAQDRLTSLAEEYANLAKAEATKDKQQIETSQARIRLYEAQVKAFVQDGQRHQQIAKLDQTNIDAVVSEYKTKMRSLMAEHDQNVAAKDYDLTQQIATLDTLLSSAEAEIAKRKVDQAFRRGESEGELREYEISIDRMTALMDAEAVRLEAVTKIHLEDANIVASIARGAANSATSVAKVGILEEE